MFRKIFACATSLALTFGSAAVAEKISVVTHGQAGDTFWDVVHQGVKDATLVTGSDVTYTSPETYDMTKMAALIDAEVDKGIDALVVSLPNADALGPSIKRAVDAGIKVLSINSGSDEAYLLGVQLHVGQNEFSAGRTAGEQMFAAGGKRAICINQEVGNIALDLRCAGFAQGFSGQVDMLSTTLDVKKTFSLIRAALKQNPDIDTVLTLSADTVAIPALAAVEADGLSDKVTIGTFDLSDGVLKAVSEGKLAFAIDQQQYYQGYLPIKLLAEYFETGEIPDHDIPTGSKLVDAATAKGMLAN